MSELSEIVDAVSEKIETLRMRAEKAEASANEYKRMCVRLMEMVDRERLSYAERVQIEEFERRAS